MKSRFISVGHKKEEWFVDFVQKYEKKINPLLSFDFLLLKPKGLARESSQEKIKKESEQILQKISPKDRVILFDEFGKKLDSIEFSKKVVQAIESAPSSVVFVVGGAFGVSQELKQRADLVCSLSDMTFNHLVAQTVVLEQIYRAMTIWKGISYHNV